MLVQNFFEVDEYSTPTSNQRQDQRNTIAYLLVYSDSRTSDVLGQNHLDPLESTVTVLIDESFYAVPI